jgi:hypothetical protein
MAKASVPSYKTFSPEHGDNPIHLGRMVRKVRSDRVGQISAITDTHAVVYWPDYEDHRNNPEQTYVRLERFRRAGEWELL